MQPVHRALCLFLVSLSALAGHGQSPPPRLAFDVAAIHPSAPGQNGGGIKPLPNGTGYMVKNMTVKVMMAVMFRIPARQIVGGPDWFGSAPFDVEARADRTYGLEDLHTMFKNLLADRFGLRFHIETKQGPVYELVLDKSGLKMKPDPAGGGLNIPITPTGPGQFTGTRVPMPYFCWFLGQQEQNDPRPVIDKTGLTQFYDFTLKFAPELPPGAVLGDDAPPELRSLPSLADALQDQLGLKLIPAKGPLQTYVIDRLEMPTAN